MVGGATLSGRAAEPWPAENTPVTVAPVAGWPDSQELSGAVWNPVTQRVYVVDDNSGRITSMDATGRHSRSWRVGPAGDTDHEAITFADYDSPHVYVGVEQSPPGQAVRKVRQYELGGATARLVQSWTLPELGGDANSGLEGLTFVPNAFLTRFPAATTGVYNAGRGSRFGSGGLFFAGLQADGTVYVYDLDIRRSTTNAVFVHKFTPVPGRTDLAELTFDRGSGLLYLLWDSANLLATWTVPTVTEPNGRRQQEWTLWPGGAGRSDEGLAVVPADADARTQRLFLTDDHGALLYRFDHWPRPGPAASPTPPTSPGPTRVWP